MAKDMQRTLTPEEQARRKAALSGDPLKAGTFKTAPSQTSEFGGPVESPERRIARARAAVGPLMVDYDRDGFPDGIVGRGQRNLPRPVGPGTLGYAGQRPNLGMDSFRQDQIGYRDRLRAMQAAAIQMVSDAEEEKDEDEDPQAAARLKALSQMTVMSHGSTGVPGGLPKRPDPPQPPDGGGDLPPMPEAPPQPVIRRTSYGTVPSQGTLQPDGSFVLGGSTPPDTVPAKEGAKVTHTKTTERTTTVEPAKPHEHKPHEVHRPHETHKPSEHKK